MVFGKHLDWRGPHLVFGNWAPQPVWGASSAQKLSSLLLPKKTAAAPFTSKGVGNMEHLLEDQDAHIQCIYVGLEIWPVSDFFFFFGHLHLISRNWWDCAVRERCHFINWHTTRGKTYIPPLPVNHLNTIYGIFWTIDDLWFLRVPSSQDSVWSTARSNTCLCTAVVQYTDMSLGFHSNFMCMGNSVPQSF